MSQLNLNHRISNTETKHPKDKLIVAMQQALAKALLTTTKVVMSHTF